jgi:hypothetical protein
VGTDAASAPEIDNNPHATMVETTLPRRSLFTNPFTPCPSKGVQLCTLLEFFPPESCSVMHIPRYMHYVNRQELFREYCAQSATFETLMR